MVKSVEARVLICDPDRKISAQISNLLYERFGNGEPPLERNLSHFLSGQRPFIHSNVEIRVVDSPQQAHESVVSHPAPYYSLVVFEAENAKETDRPRYMAAIRDHDPFMPLLEVGRSIDADFAGSCARSGVKYFGEEERSIQDQIERFFRRRGIIPNLTVVKFGGSLFDYDRVGNPENLETVIQTLIEYHGEGGEDRTRKTANRLLLNVGMGQFGDTVKDWQRSHGHVATVRAHYPQAAANALMMNVEMVRKLFGEGGAARINPQAFYYIGAETTYKRIPIIAIAPHHILVRDKIPLEDSDTHTIALAEHYGAQRVVIIKRTDGIYAFDPYRGFPIGIPLTQENHERHQQVRKAAQANNERYERLTVGEVLGGAIKREGTDPFGQPDGSSGHLIEDSALRYMRTHCRYLQEIVVVHIAPEEMYIPGKEGTYQHIITGEQMVLPDGGWKEVLRRSIRDACNGVAKSRICRKSKITHS